MKKPIVHIFTLGGTIAMTKEEGSTAGVVPTLTGEALVASVPELKNIAEIHVEQIRQLSSSQLQFDDIDEVVKKIQALEKEKSCNGVVITQGTDTIEETAFILDRLLNVSFPVVVTGAMRNPTLSGSDGPANILASVLVSCSQAARGCGVLVVLNDEIHAARFAYKTHTTLPNAFVSANTGRIGWLSENQVHILVRPEPMPTITPAATPQKAIVPLVKVGFGDNGELLSLLNQQATQFQGLVIEGTGGGHVSKQCAEIIAEIAKKIPIVIASRTGSGVTLTQTYGYPGSEIDLLNKGVITAGWLDGTKARILLTLLLRHQTNNRKKIAEAFSTWGGYIKS